MRVILPGVLLSLVACGSGGDLCARLQSEGLQCDRMTTQMKCTSAITAEKTEKPACAPMVDALVACLVPLRLTCTGSSSIAAVGDGESGPGQNFTDVGGQSVVVNDLNCSRYRRGLAACRSCPTAVGATEVEAIGIAEACPGVKGAPCATGLTCTSGVCTKSCTADAECAARADDCKLSFQYPNVCKNGKCVRSCSDDFLCQSVVSTSRCVEKACSL